MIIIHTDTYSGLSAGSPVEMQTKLIGVIEDGEMELPKGCKFLPISNGPRANA